MALYTYPSNKLEHLVEVLSKLLDYETKEVFTPSQLIVGSHGMQCWLNMHLAESRGISMNLNYDMVDSFIIKLCYGLVGKQEHKGSYTKVVLTWRVFRLLDDVKEPKLKEYYQNSLLKKYQLSVKIAENFCKYLSYRSHWLQAWEKGLIIDSKPHEDELWQMRLWQLLVVNIADTPYKIQYEAMNILSDQVLKKSCIPSNIYIFGVSTILPKDLNFIYELAKYTNIYILYINPCSEYGYDFKKEKISAWLSQDDYESQPLLANLGQHGKDFFNKLLANQDKEEFKMFSKENFYFERLEQSNQTQLVSLQRNLLELNCKNYSETRDDSVTINSCHSPLREIQVLHDKLLNMIKKDNDIRPRDILVLCLNIEDYSPYIDSVFSRFPKTSQLPCSIVDRTLLNSEPLVASFIDLLQLPETNFEVNKIMDYLLVPAIQNKFSISDNQLKTIRYWLKEACIHHHNDGSIFSWSWGLKRLMLGFSYSDHDEIIDDKVFTRPVVDGDTIMELGGLYELMELLSDYAQGLTRERTVNEWQKYLLEMLENVFDVTNKEVRIGRDIRDTIVKITQLPYSLFVNEKLDLYTIRYCLISQLSEPVINNHFLNGKVTFCSMSHMRNVPFKVVAMLGLNNDKFPRQESTVSFDLMARLSRSRGDVTKKDDDRYLFLESLISAREYFYLSFLGKNIKTNKEQESSLVLKELESYLQQNYGWCDNVKKYSLHAFSKRCYNKNYRSYDSRWLKFIGCQSKQFDNGQISTEPKIPYKLSVLDLVRTFDNPLKTYAQKTLELSLEDYSYELEDSEPFDINGLEKYQLKQNIFDLIIKNVDISIAKKISNISGKLPASMLTDIICDKEYAKLEILISEGELFRFSKEYFEVNIAEHKLTTNAYICGGELRLFTISTFLIRHKFELYLTALLAFVNKDIKYEVSYYYFDREKDKAIKFEFLNIDYANALSLLKHYIKKVREINTKSMLTHLNLAEAVLSDNKNGVKSDKQKQEAWHRTISDNNNPVRLDKDEYFRLFYPQNPGHEELADGVYDEFFLVVNSK